MWAPSSSYSQPCCNNKRPYAKTSFKNMHFSTHEKAFQQFATEPKNPSICFFKLQPFGAGIQTRVQSMGDLHTDRTQ